MLLSDGCILRWEWIALETEIANPQFRPIVNLAHRIQDGPTGAACTQYGVVGNCWQIGTLLDRLIQAAQWDHQTGRIDSTRWPHVPCETDAIPIFVLLDVLLVRGHRSSSLFRDSRGIERDERFSVRFLLTFSNGKLLADI